MEYIFGVSSTLSWPQQFTSESWLEMLDLEITLSRGFQGNFQGCTDSPSASCIEKQKSAHLRIIHNWTRLLLDWIHGVTNQFLLHLHCQIIIPQYPTITFQWINHHCVKEKKQVTSWRTAFPPLTQDPAWHHSQGLQCAAHTIACALKIAHLACDSDCWWLKSGYQ